MVFYRNISMYNIFRNYTFLLTFSLDAKFAKLREILKELEQNSNWIKTIREAYQLNYTHLANLLK